MWLFERLNDLIVIGWGEERKLDGDQGCEGMKIEEKGLNEKWNGQGGLSWSWTDPQSKWNERWVNYGSTSTKGTASKECNIDQRNCFSEGEMIEGGNTLWLRHAMGLVPRISLQNADWIEQGDVLRKNKNTSRLLHSLLIIRHVIFQCSMILF